MGEGGFTLPLVRGTESGEQAEPVFIGHLKHVFMAFVPTPRMRIDYATMLCMDYRGCKALEGLSILPDC